MPSPTSNPKTQSSPQPPSLTPRDKQRIIQEAEAIVKLVGPEAIDRALKEVFGPNPVPSKPGA